MMGFPTIPGWDGIHPAMVQFAIVLLLVAPLILFISLFARGTWRAWASAALLLMGLGTVAAWMAVGSGHAAGQLVDKSPLLIQAVTAHEALGVQTLTLFASLTGVFIVLMLLPRWIKKPIPGGVRIGVHAVFLVIYLGSALVIVNAADRGGRLVHELGVRAMVASRVAASTEANPAGGEAREVPKPQPPPPSEERVVQ